MTADDMVAGPEPRLIPPIVLPERITSPRRLSQRFPVLFPWAVRAHRLRRRVAWLRSDAVWAVRRAAPPTPYGVKKHKSLLLRQLGESQMWLQHNKVTNLRLAAGLVDGVVIGPGETFSFNKVVGNCTRRRGFVDAMVLSDGEAAAGVGGGICQLANLLVWMFMHSDLTVVERSEHSFDPFPDNGRVLPWGVGCSIVYNYVDLVVRNDSATTFVVRTRVSEKYLEGTLSCDKEPSHSYSVQARDEVFLRRGDDVFRRNEIWRTVTDRRTGNRVGEQLLRTNCALVKYVPTGVAVHDVRQRPGR